MPAGPTNQDDSLFPRRELVERRAKLVERNVDEASVGKILSTHARGLA